MCSLTSRTMSLSAATVKHPTKTASLETAKTVPELGEGGGGDGDASESALWQIE